MFCTKCGNQIEKNSKFCTKCGKEILESRGNNKKKEEFIENEKKNNNKTLLLVILITGVLVFTILFLNSMTSSDKTNNSHNNILSSNSNDTDTNNDFYKKDENIQKSTVTNKDFGEYMVKQLMNLGFTIDEATEIQSIFYQIGINYISNIKGAGDGIDKLQTFVAYANNDTKKKFYFTVENRTMFYAGFMDATLYDTSKGGVLTKIDDVHIPETKVNMDTYTTLQVKAQEAVKQYLNYPDTASFPLYDGWGIARKDDEYKIYGKLTASNGFGVKNSVNFSVWFKEENNTYSVEAIELNGTRVK